LIVPKEVPMRFSRILVPTDFSAGAEEAARTAMALAAAVGGRVELVHLYNPPSLMLPDGSTFGATPAQLVETTDRAEAALAQSLQRLRAHGDGTVELDGCTRMGSAADEILRLAESGRYDLVVMGTHGRTGIRRLMLGSVAENVLRRASIPVLTVRELDPHAPRADADAR
jgi:nucleotide-binding universal stress UspA family protein